MTTAPSSLTRKQFLRSVGSVALGALVSRRVVARQPGGEVLRRERITRLLREYDSQGDHRTGSAVDAESGRWLADQVADAGLEPEIEWMGFSRPTIQAAYVEVNDRRADGIPLFDGGITDAVGVRGRLGALGDNADIGLAHVGPRVGPDLLGYRRTTSHQAAVTVTGGPSNGVPEGLALMNAPDFKEPFGPPVLQVASQHRPWLDAAAAAGAEARVVAHVTRRPEEVFNVTAALLGTEPSLAPLIVMTPRSGWWTCASERGGGIAVWLEMMRAMRAATPRRTTVFVASTGHELGHYGLHEFLRTRSRLVTSAVAWIHLGANFGAAIGGRPRLQASSIELQHVALDALSAAGAQPDQLHPVGERPAGEAHNIYDGGGRYLSILGDNGLFHHPQDRWPTAVDVDLIARHARAFAEIGTTLASS